MARISFKAKTQEIQDLRDKTWRSSVRVPRIKKSHCDMEAFRRHKRYRAYANSDLFEGMINGYVKRLFPDGWVRLDELPPGVEVFAGFLVTVNIEIPEEV